MHTYEALGHMIIQELINVRNDFKNEIQRLGDRFEKCLSFRDVTAENSDPDENVVIKESSKIPTSESIDFLSVSTVDDCSNSSISATIEPKFFSSSIHEYKEISQIAEAALLENSQQLSVLSGNESALMMKYEKECATGSSFPKPNPLNVHSLPVLDVATSLSIPVSSDVMKALLPGTVCQSNSSILSEKELPAIPKLEEELDNKSFETTKPQILQSLFDIASNTNAPASLLNNAAYPADCSLRSRFQNMNQLIVKKCKRSENITGKRKCPRPHEKSFQCDICQNFFYTRGSLKSHKKTHLGLKPHACALCSLSFTRKIDLTRHMRLHTGETPFSCERCGRKFGRKDKLKLHMRLHNVEKVILPNDGKSSEM